MPHFLFVQNDMRNSELLVNEFYGSFTNTMTSMSYNKQVPNKQHGQIEPAEKRAASTLIITYLNSHWRVIGAFRNRAQPIHEDFLFF